MLQSLTTVTIVGRWPTLTGRPAAGEVSFVATATAHVAVDHAIIPKVAHTEPLDDQGAISVVLPALDDPDLTPAGMRYLVTERIRGTASRSYYIDAPAAAGTVYLDTAAQAEPGPPLTSYVLASTVGKPSGLATLDDTGKVPAAQIPPTGSVPDATPAAKGVIQLGGDLGGTATAPTVPGLAGKADTAAVNAGLAGRATKPIVRRAYITTGDVTLAANATWTPLPGFELAIPAAVGDDVELSVGALFQLPGSDFLDLVALVGSAPTTIARRASTGTAAATAADEGDPGLYPNASNNSFRVSNGVFGFTVAAGDLDGGNVRFALVAKGTGGGKVFASASYPFRWRARNSGPVN